MYAAFSMFHRYCCPNRKPADATPPQTELNETKKPADETDSGSAANPAPPETPPSTPIIAPVATCAYPDLPTLNPSLVRQDDGTYSV